MSVIVENIHNEIKQYLLGQLTEDAEERVELRLMSDTAYTQEFDAAVAEITDQYVAGEFRGEERKHVEEYFLASEERRNQARFVAALKNHANAERGAVRAVSGPKVRDSAVKPAGQLEPAVVAGLWHSWSSQPAAWRLATATALLVMLVGLYMLVQMGGGSRTAFASLDLTISESDRATGSTAPSITRDAAQLRATLRFPASMPEARDYRVKLASDPTKTFTPIEKHSDSVTVQIPIAYFREGRNGLQLFVIKPDGTEERVRGTYYFDLK